MKISLRTSKNLDRKLKRFEKAVITAQTRSLNKTAKKVRTQAAKEIGSQVALKAGYIKTKLQIIKANKNNDHAVVFTTSRGVLLSRYSNSQLRRKSKITGNKKSAGISVKVKKSGKRKKMRGAFYIKLKNSGVTGIAVRKKGAKGKDNYKVVHGPSVSQVWDSVRGDIKHDAQSWLYDTTKHELDRELRKIRA